MAPNNIQQPNMLNIDDRLRLRAYDGNFQVAVPWYQDETVYDNSDVNAVHNTIKRVHKLCGDCREC